MPSPTRVVVGGGLFGCWAAIVLADAGHDVLLLELADELLTRASRVNQARLHTGLHYPRSLLTARETLAHYRQFRERFPTAVHDFEQVYAVAQRGSKTSGSDFASFLGRLDLEVDEVRPERWFVPGTVARAFRVEEPTFDVDALRQELRAELAARRRITVRTGTAVLGGTVDQDGVWLHLPGGERLRTEGVVLAAYAGTNGLRQALGLVPLPLQLELAEVLLGDVGGPLADVGFTVMDGPFWSLMPFGHSPRASLTTVGLTPLRRQVGQARFLCQDERVGCSPLALADCCTCPVRPRHDPDHAVAQMALFLKDASAFTPRESLLTVKAVLSATEVDDARPTLVQREPEGPVWTVLSGKVTTLFDLERELV